MLKFLGVALGLLLATCGQAAAAALGKTVVYAAVGPDLTQYDVDLDGAALTRRASVELPDAVQYAWPHPSRRFLYVAWSNGAGKDHHGVSVFRIDRSGALQPLGNPVP